MSGGTALVAALKQQYAVGYRQVSVRGRLCTLERVHVTLSDLLELPL